MMNMMNKLKNIFILLLIAAVVSVGVAGCSNDSEHPTSDHPTSEHPTSDHPTSEHPE